MSDPITRDTVDIARLEGKVDNLLDLYKTQSERFDSVFKLLQDHQTAINESEKWRAMIMGTGKVVMVIGVAAWSIAMVAITALINKVFKS